MQNNDGLIDASLPRLEVVEGSPNFLQLPDFGRVIDPYTKRKEEGA